MKKAFLLLFITFPILLLGQKQKISLEQAIELAQKKSPDYKSNINKNQASYWRYRNYKASFLPQVRLNATLPSYSNSSRRITNDNGQDIFVNQNQSRIEGRLSVAQNVPYTGGTLSINSQLERIDILGDNASTGYFVTPFAVNYNQNSIVYNPFKGEKKIEINIYWGRESGRETTIYPQ